MSVEYEWHFDDSSPGQESGEDERTGRSRRRTVFTVAAVVILLASLGTYVVWRLRRAPIAETVADVEAAVQLELRALQEGDTELYLGLQDPENDAWMESRRARLAQGSLLPPPVPGFVATTPLTIERTTVIGDRAEVTYTRLAGPPRGELYPFRAVSFYRLASDGRWVHTAPDTDYAGQPVMWASPRIDLAGHTVEADLFEQLALDLELTAAALCELLVCPDDLRFTLALTDTLVSETARADVLPAPHLTGVPQGEAATAIWTRGIENYLVDLMLVRLVGEPVGGLIDAALRAQVKEYLGLGQAYEADRELLAEALEEGRVPALLELWLGSVPAAQATIAEDATAVFVRFIEDEYGRDGVIALLFAASRAASLDPLFPVVLGAEAAVIEERWLDYLRQETGSEASLPILLA
jgi:hypothetical protein